MQAGLVSCTRAHALTRAQGITGPSHRFPKRAVWLPQFSRLEPKEGCPALAKSREDAAFVNTETCGATATAIVPETVALQSNQDSTCNDSDTRQKK